MFLPLLAVLPIIMHAVMIVHVAVTVLVRAVFPMLLTNLIRTMIVMLAIHLLRDCQSAIHCSEYHRKNHELLHAVSLHEIETAIKPVIC